MNFTDEQLGSIVLHGTPMERELAATVIRYRRKISQSKAIVFREDYPPLRLMHFSSSRALEREFMEKATTEITTALRDRFEDFVSVEEEHDVDGKGTKIITAKLTVLP